MLRENNQKLIKAKFRRLQKLKEQQSLKGINSSPELLIEIEDLESEIEQLQTKLKTQESVAEMTSQTNNPNDTKIRPQKARPVKSTIWGISQVWWVPIIVALVGLIGVIIPLVVNNKVSTFQPFTYTVRVQKEGTNQNISNAKVTIEVAGQAPLDEITDSNGFARIFITDSYVTQVAT